MDRPKPQYTTSIVFDGDINFWVVGECNIAAGRSLFPGSSGSTNDACYKRYCGGLGIYLLGLVGDKAKGAYCIWTI